ncbi:synaptotagmin-8 isoform X1 [Camelus ferus]|uniref:Synaptotagmin-8 isoform X1 n=1 Tax=Camelus ferus TaxID=419612 RepID=A0A8B8TUZ3_CAMFR|nr:synaptotagmin-8 isoform X1 [Camelus ferus]
MGWWAGARGVFLSSDLAALAICSKLAACGDGAPPRPLQCPGPSGHLGWPWTHSRPHHQDPLVPLGTRCRHRPGWRPSGFLPPLCLLLLPPPRPPQEEAQRQEGCGSGQGLWHHHHPPAHVTSPCDVTQVQPDVDNVESGPGGPQQWGRLQLSLEYDFGSQEIKVGLRQAADLRPGGPRATADPYARVSLSPLSGRSHETKVHRSTLCLVFDETCCFHVSLGSAGWGPGPGGGAGSHPCPQVPPDELPQTALRVQVLDGRSLSQHQPLAELSLPLGAVDLQHVLELWLQLGPPGAAEPEQVGELCCSLRYVPGSGRLTVVVLEARGLSPGLAEPYVKVQLLLKQRKWKKRKTSARKGTAAPYFNEAFTFPVPFSQIQPASPQSVDLVLAVWARGPQFRPEPVGKVVLGARASGQPLQHWADMLAHARRPVVQWHRLQPAREVDRALALQPRWRLPLPGS